MWQLLAEVFSAKLEETDNPFILKVIQGYQISLSSEPAQFASLQKFKRNRRTDTCRSGVRKMLENQAIKLVQPL